MTAAWKSWRATARGLAARREVEPNASDSGSAHGVEVALRCMVVNHGHAAGIRTASFHSIQRGGIIGPIDAGRHDHHACHMERPMERRHLRGQGRLRRITAPGPEWKSFLVAEDVRVAVAGVRRDGKIHCRRRLRRFSIACRAARQSGCPRQYIAPCQHITPIYCRRQTGQPAVAWMDAAGDFAGPQALCGKGAPDARAARGPLRPKVLEYHSGCHSG